MSKLSIVAKIMAILNLTDDGKVENFFMKQRASLAKDIKNLGKNLDTVNDQKNEAIEELNERLEDAKVRVEDAYTGVTIENVATNEKASDFAGSYWAAVEKAEREVARLEAEVVETTKSYDKRLEGIKADIAKRQARLDKLSEPA